jgi:hypothetical protein
MGFATYITIDGRIYYDGIFRASVLLASEGSYGLLFRFID